MALTEDKAELLKKYGQYVRSLANTVRRQFKGQYDIEDLVSYGNLGLFEAADRFDSKHGTNFLTFAHYRIKGAIFDGLRKMGTLKGADQRAASYGQAAASFLGTSASGECGRPQSVADDIRDVEVAIASLATIFVASSQGWPDEGMNQEERLEIAQLRVKVKNAIDDLPEGERKLLIAYYYEGKTLEEAGATIGQSKSWASRLHARAIGRLREALTVHVDEPMDKINPRSESLTRSVRW